ncbi:MAG: carbohydrate binding domain-containing protein, partial [Clostridia bacterium]|nr:carbohydrate binding domain-containing protein [Clostridia bacterium]
MKKNMRKLLALLVTVAMLCTVVPFGALVSASTNLVKNGDFESGDTSNWNNDAGNGFTVVEESGDKCAYLEYNAADWGNIYQYVNVEKNTDYVFSYSYKADSRFKMIFSVMGGDWVTSLGKATFDSTGEWVTNSVEFNSGDFATIIIFVQSNHYAKDGHTVYVDDISVVKKADLPAEPDEPEEPEDGNLIVNGDFETGDNTGWDVAADKITAAAAKDGKFGLLASGGAYAGGSV